MNRNKNIIIKTPSFIGVNKSSEQNLKQTARALEGKQPKISYFYTPKIKHGKKNVSRTAQQLQTVYILKYRTSNNKSKQFITGRSRLMRT